MGTARGVVMRQAYKVQGLTLDQIVVRNKGGKPHDL